MGERSAVDVPVSPYVALFFRCFGVDELIARVTELEAEVGRLRAEVARLRAAALDRAGLDAYDGS